MSRSGVLLHIKQLIREDVLFLTIINLDLWQEIALFFDHIKGCLAFESLRIDLNEAILLFDDGVRVYQGEFILVVFLFVDVLGEDVRAVVTFKVMITSIPPMIAFNSRYAATFGMQSLHFHRRGRVLVGPVSIVEQL